ncbi:MAG: SRPBCC family protein [Gemmatimonadales bacterium]|jgi:carbon monoxide dehydrogenase subunit G
MPIEFDVTQHIPGPPDRVFHTLTDLDAAAEWMPGFVHIEKLSQGEFGVGSEWRETRKFLGREATEQFEVTRCQSPTELTVRVDGSKGSSRRGEYLFQYRLEPKGAGTDVTLHAAIRGLGRFGTLLGRLFVGQYKKACVNDLSALARHFEGPG